jgi:hypothetical protein
MDISQLQWKKLRALLSQWLAQNRGLDFVIRRRSSAAAP